MLRARPTVTPWDLFSTTEELIKKMRLQTIIALIAVGLGQSAAAEPEKKPARLELVAGGGTGGDGSSATQAKLISPFGVDFDSAGTLYFVELVGSRVRRIGPDGRVTTLAGTGRYEGGDGDGPAANSLLNGPHSLAVSARGDIFVADTWNNRIRKIDGRSGQIRTIAGTGRKGFSGDGGPAIRAEFGGVYCLALDQSAQTLDVADLDNRRIRRVDLKTGIVSTMAGNGKKGNPADGDEAIAAPLVDPRAVANDGQGNLYILERNGNCAAGRRSGR